MNQRLLAVLTAVALLGAAACDKKSSTGSEPAASAPTAAVPAAAPVPIPAANPALLSPQTAVEKAPEVFKAKFSTTKGDFVLEVHRAWSPNGADRFYNLVKIGFFDGCAYFRVMDRFMAQTGIHGDPAVAAKWQGATIPDDPSAGQHNTRGMASFATAGPNTRTTQFFINFIDNSMLDTMGFTPFGKVVEGDAVLDQLYRGYGDGPPQGNGPVQGQIVMQGNAYLKASFPEMDYIKTARLVP